MAVLTERIAALFERLPMLCGFHVTESLAVVEITLRHGTPPCVQEVNAAIRSALQELLDDIEDGVDVLGGTTFARVIH